MAYVLILDTAGNKGQMVLAQDGKVRAYRVVEEGRLLGEQLHPEIQRLMTQQTLDFTALDAIGVVGGPGSYTGLRVGMAAAQGLAVALDKPLLVADRLALLMTALPSTEERVLLLPARTGEWFVRVADANGNTLLETTLLTTPELKAYLENNLPDARILLAGSGPEAQAEMSGYSVMPCSDWASPELLCQYFNKLFQEKKFLEPAQARPIYIKAAYISGDQ